jgi:cobyrinic acid a,c-diamide synthase
MTRGLIVSAVRSGAGKTTVALGLMRAFARRGPGVQPYKCGPDYIDPAFHAAAAGRPSYNLDSWAMSPGMLADLVTRHPADLVVTEGVMGLFDGAGGRGATSDIAASLGWPVLLVLDVKGQIETAAAVAAGCANHRDDVSIAGVILNRIASARHLAMIRPAFERVGIRLFGGLASDPRFALPERHLGLVQAVETADLEQRLDAVADALAGAVDLDAICHSARRSPFYIRTCSIAGAARARRSCRSRRWPTRHPRQVQMRSGCPAAIPSCMPAGWRPRPASSVGCAKPRRAASRSTASAAATWCWGRGWRTPTAGATPWRTCSRSRPRSPSAACTSVTAARG